MLSPLIIIWFHAYPSNKCLGVLLDEKLTFETHIEYICKKACAGIGALRRIQPFVPPAPS